jgi:alanine dehydrogenase
VRLRPGSAIVDIAIDQGGCCETSRPTTHQDPTFIVHNVVHYCVANMPGAVPKTATYALTNATLNYGLVLADQGVEKAIAKDPALALGLNTWGGKVMHPAVAATFGMECAAV